MLTLHELKEILVYSSRALDYGNSNDNSHFFIFQSVHISYFIFYSSNKFMPVNITVTLQSYS